MQAELAAAYQSSNDSKKSAPELQKVFTYLSRVSLPIIQSYRNELVTAAACEVIANSITLENAQATGKTHWREIVDFALKSSSVVIQEAVARAMASISKLVDCSLYVQR